MSVHACVALNWGDSCLLSFTQILLELPWLLLDLQAVGLLGDLWFLFWLHYVGTSFPRDLFIKISWWCASCLWPCLLSLFKQTVHSCKAEHSALSMWIKHHSGSMIDCQGIGRKSENSSQFVLNPPWLNLHIWNYWSLVVMGHSSKREGLYLILLECLLA